MDDKCKRLKKYLVNIWYPSVGGQCNEISLELRFDPVPKQTAFYVLQWIGRKTITYENAFPRKNRGLLSERQVKYVEDIIVKRDTANLELSGKEVIEFISYIGQEK